MSTDNLPAVPNDLNTGLEDFGVEDAVVPRLQIVHKEGEFKDSLTGAQFSSLKTVILGLVKQRILWHQTVDDGDKPMCKSPDHDWGFPNVDDDTPKDKRFPWGKSGFSKDDFPPNEEGFIQLPCARCALKEWGSHPDGNKPYCAEQYTLPLFYDPYDTGSWVPAILTIQKTSIKGLRSYLTGFARSKNPAYTAITEIGLKMAQRGTTDYSIATFREIGKTDSEDWREFSANYGQLRNFLTAHPKQRSDEEDGDVGPTSDNTAKAPESQPEVNPEPETKETVQPAGNAGGGSPSSKGAVPASTDDDEDDLPF